MCEAEGEKITKTSFYVWQKRASICDICDGMLKKPKKTLLNIAVSR